MRATPCMTKYTKIGKQVRVRAFVFRIRDQVTVGHVLDCWDFKIMHHQNNWKCRHLCVSVCLCLCESLNSDLHENLDSTPCHHLSHECMSESSIRTPWARSLPLRANSQLAFKMNFTLQFKWQIFQINGQVLVRVSEEIQFVLRKFVEPFLWASVEWRGTKMWASWRGTCCTISLNQPLCHYSAHSHMAEACCYLCAAPFHGTAGSGGKHSHVFVHVHILKAMDVAPMATELKSALLQPCDSRLIEWVKSLSQPPYSGRDEKYKISWLLGVRCPALL